MSAAYIVLTTSNSVTITSNIFSVSINTSVLINIQNFCEHGSSNVVLPSYPMHLSYVLSSNLLLHGCLLLLIAVFMCVCLLVFIVSCEKQRLFYQWQSCLNLCSVFAFLRYRQKMLCEHQKCVYFLCMLQESSATSRSFVDCDTPTVQVRDLSHVLSGMSISTKFVAIPSVSRQYWIACYEHNAHPSS